MSQQKGHTSKPPSWSTLFPGGVPATPLPQYTEYSEAYIPSFEKAYSPSPSRSRWYRGGRTASFAVSVIALCSVLITAKMLFETPQPRYSTAVNVFPAVDDRLSPRTVLNGRPTASYTQNLRDDVQYITGWIGAGWTNDVMTYTNLIYLALLTERVPIMGVFAPSHLPRDAGFVAFGDVFDVPRLSAGINKPVLEWRDVKDTNSTQMEQLGCWSSWMGAGTDITQPRGTMIPGLLNLDVSYTQIPYEHKLLGQGDPHILFQRLMQLGFPSGRREALGKNAPLPSAGSGALIEPDEHMLCFDFLYYVSVDRMYEWELDWSPQWRFVGKHMHWAPQLQALANTYLNRHFGTPVYDPVPPFISVHVRRGDFRWSCPAHDDSCLPTVNQLERRVNEVKAALVARGVHTDRVLITSDETDAVWWADVRSRGYTSIDHTAERTDEIYGKWFSPLLDAVFQSQGAGFVGTDGSTMSLIAERRVQDWQGGPVARLRWRNIDPADL